MSRAVLTALVWVSSGAAAFGQSGNYVAAARGGWTSFNPVTALTASTFAQPPAADRPWVRMGEPENLFEPATGQPLDREVSLERIE
jgi:hypothetical protein